MSSCSTEDGSGQLDMVELRDAPSLAQGLGGQSLVLVAPQGAPHVESALLSDGGGKLTVLLACPRDTNQLAGLLRPCSRWPTTASGSTGCGLRRLSAASAFVQLGPWQARSGNADGLISHKDGGALPMPAAAVEGLSVFDEHGKANGWLSVGFSALAGRMPLALCHCTDWLAFTNMW